VPVEREWAGSHPSYADDFLRTWKYFFSHTGSSIIDMEQMMYNNIL
jgi:hypothetical protein